MMTPNRSYEEVTQDSNPEFGTNVGEKILEVPEARRALEQVIHSDQAGWGACNVGRTEQKMRLIAGAGLLAAAAFTPRLNAGWRAALGIFGAIEIITGSTRHCPVWSALGINTARGEEC